MAKKSSVKFEVAVRMRLNLETLNLILKPQSVNFLKMNLMARDKVLGFKFNTFLWLGLFLG